MDKVEAITAWRRGVVRVSASTHPPRTVWGGRSLAHRSLPLGAKRPMGARREMSRSWYIRRVRGANARGS